MPTCPNGHQSGSDDWCEVCGHRMAGAVPPPSPPPPAPGGYGFPPPAGHPGTGRPPEFCPQCRTPREGAAPFCEECRWNFLTNTATSYTPAAPRPPGGGPPPGFQTGPPGQPNPGPTYGGGADAYDYQGSRPSQMNRPAEPIPPFGDPGRERPGGPGPGPFGGPGGPGGPAGPGGPGGPGGPVGPGGPGGHGGPGGPGPGPGGPGGPAGPGHGHGPGPFGGGGDPSRPVPPPPGPGGPGGPGAHGGAPQAFHQPGPPPPPAHPGFPQETGRPQAGGPPFGGGEDDWVISPPTGGQGGPGGQQGGYGAHGGGPGGPAGPGGGYGYPQPGSTQAPPPPAQQRPLTWTATIGPDRDYFLAMMQRSGPEAAGLNLPAYSPEQQRTLTGNQFTIGRRRHSTGETPDIDLSVPPEDPGVSHQHAVLVQQHDGTWAVVDQNSTNGTTVNGSEEPIQPFVPVPLQDGDRVHVGAWTTITIRRG
ncbi:FHA domain-containing protein [Streptomyces sp. NPDC059477]|uniref:FHA domain-containing protein n=1 Tax=Streptomyces sp. NPDC059477 TaxID=3346847 RepID=UPI0036AEE138